MTEAEWQTSSNLDHLRALARGEASDRKFRLFAVACCRRHWNDLPDDAARAAVDIAEKQADGLASEAELAEARSADPCNLTHESLRIASQDASDFAAMTAGRLAQEAAQLEHQLDELELDTVIQEAFEREVDELIVLFRHIMGNPFRLYPAPSSCPSSITALAEAVYQGDSMARAPLHDALLEAGYPDLAQHFIEPDHPKGCWALDLILGKS